MRRCAKPARRHFRPFDAFSVNSLIPTWTTSPSMQTYRKKYAPGNAVLFSEQGANQMDHGLLHAPLYLAGALTLQGFQGHE